jgi:hypothetical protein
VLDDKYPSSSVYLCKGLELSIAVLTLSTFDSVEPRIYTLCFPLLPW